MSRQQDRKMMNRDSGRDGRGIDMQGGGRLDRSFSRMVRILIFLAVLLIDGCASVSHSYCSRSYSICETHQLDAENNRDFMDLDND